MIMMSILMLMFLLPASLRIPVFIYHTVFLHIYIYINDTAPCIFWFLYTKRVSLYFGNLHWSRLTEQGLEPDAAMYCRFLSIHRDWFFPDVLKVKSRYILERRLLRSPFPLQRFVGGKAVVILRSINHSELSFYCRMERTSYDGQEESIQDQAWSICFDWIRI